MKSPSIAFSQDFDLDRLWPFLEQSVSSVIMTCLNSLLGHLADIEIVGTTTGMKLEGSYKEMNVQGGSLRWLAPITLLRTYFQYVINLLTSFDLSTTKSSGKDIFMISGDHSAAIKSIAAKLGVALKKTQSQYLPANQRRSVKEFSDREAIILREDGTNNFIALAQVEIGVHICKGTNVDQSAADILLMYPSLTIVHVHSDVMKAAH